MENRFECLFERSEKGIYLDVEKNKGHIDLSMFYDFKHQVSVCLDKEDTEKLITLLQGMIKEL